MAHGSIDRMMSSLAERRANRRTALTAGLAGAASLTGLNLTRAQDATPEANGEASPMFLFVQLAEAGTWTPSAEDPDVFLLTLTGIGSQTAFFSDRPERIVGTVDTNRFLDSLGFTPANPPNAAAVVRTPEGERDVLVVELFDPVYTRQFGTESGDSLTYKARVLDAYRGDNLTSWYDEQDNPELPSQFDQISLFIDDCPDLIYCCFLPGQWPDGCPIGSGIHVGTCWNKDTWTCDVCEPNRDFGPECNQTYANCNNQCEAHYAGDVCFC